MMKKRLFTVIISLVILAVLSGLVLFIARRFSGNSKIQTTPVPFTAEEMSRGILKLDFETWFPYKFWVSTWSKDNTYPNGFRYKVLTAQNEKEQSIQMVIVLEEPNGNETVLVDETRLPIDYFDKISQPMRDGLETSFNIQFDQGSDLSDVRTLDEFKLRTIAADWYSQEP
jgi:hypothetical protein